MVEHLVVAEAGVGSNPIKAPRAEAALYSAVQRDTIWSGEKGPGMEANDLVKN